MSTVNDNQTQAFEIEPVQTEVRKISFSAIQVDPDSNAYRDPEDFTDEAVKPLAEDIACNGLCTPLLVQELPGNVYLLHNGHRRYTAITSNIRQGIVGFSPEMPVPALVIVGNPGELATAARVIAANIQTKSFSALGRVRAAVRLKKLSMPEADIARCLAISEIQVSRDLALGESPKWMQHVREHDIAATTAATLIKAGTDSERLDELEAAFGQWLDQTWEAIYEEEARRKEDDESSLSLSEKQPKRYLTREQITAWTQALKSGEPLGQAVFRYRALVRREKGRRRLEIEGISKDIEDLSLGELAKVTARIADLDAELRRELREKAEAERRAARESTGVEGESPGRRLLKELGLGGVLVGSDDSDEDAESEDDPPEPVNRPAMPGLLDSHGPPSGFDPLG
jgi:ParB-like chromosome segregation protein Spo0J